MSQAPSAAVAFLLAAALASARQAPFVMQSEGARAVEALMKAHDKNGDRRLNADECPEPYRPVFGRFDVDHNGFLDEGEVAIGLASPPGKARPRGAVIADFVYLVADDFVVDVWRNGERVPDAKRMLVLDVYGATAERVDVEVREGDWLVFHVVSNRLRWGGASYFAAAGMIEKGPACTFGSRSDSPEWTHCDDPSFVAAIIADPSVLSTQLARPIDVKWDQGDGRMKDLAPDWTGTAVGGNARSTWIRYVAPPPKPRGPG